MIGKQVLGLVVAVVCSGWAALACSGDDGEGSPPGSGGSGAASANSGASGGSGVGTSGGSAGSGAGTSGGSAGSAGRAGGGQGGGGAAAFTCTEQGRECYESCANTAELQCPNFVSHAECESLCQQAYAQVPDCAAQWRAAVQCGISTPQAACDSADPCASQFTAWATCRAGTTDVTNYELNWDIGVCGAPVDALPPAGSTKQCACGTGTVERAAGCTGQNPRLDCDTWEQWYCRNVSKADCMAFTADRMFADGQQFKSEQCVLRLRCP